MVLRGDNLLESLISLRCKNPNQPVGLDKFLQLLRHIDLLPSRTQVTVFLHTVRVEDSDSVHAYTHTHSLTLTRTHITSRVNQRYIQTQIKLVFKFRAQ